MKKLLLAFSAVTCVVFLSGCGSSSTTATTTATAQATTVTSTGNSTTSQSTNRIDVTDPALADYLENSGSSSSNSTLPTLTAEEQAKIGATKQIRTSDDYGISGTAQIVSQTAIQLKSFNFNGACLPLLVYLARSEDLTSPIVKVSEISAPVSNTTISLTIPSNIALTNFDSVAFYCSDNTTKAISSALFQ